MLYANVKNKIWQGLFAVVNGLYHRRRGIKLILFALIMVGGVSLQAAGMEDLKKGAATILQVVMVVTFLLTVGIAIYAGFLYSKGQTQEAKQALIACGIVASAPIIAYVMYEAMGLGDYAVDIEDGEF